MYHQSSKSAMWPCEKPWTNGTNMRWLNGPISHEAIVCRNRPRDNDVSSTCRQPMEAVRLTCHVDPYVGSPYHHGKLKRTDGSKTILRMVWRGLPANGRALFLLCPCCQTPRRFVYGWEWNKFSGCSNHVRSISWRCMACARLRYASESGYLRPPGLGRLGKLGAMIRACGNLPRPEAWLPLLFTLPEEAAGAGSGTWL